MLETRPFCVLHSLVLSRQVKVKGRAFFKSEMATVFKNQMAHAHAGCLSDPDSVQARSCNGFLRFPMDFVCVLS